VLNLESSVPRDSAGDLERLVELKERIVHRPRARRIRESAARTSRGTPVPSEERGESLAAPAPPGDVLGQLVQLKRRGAWTPPPWDRSGLGPPPSEG
jgi:hypothetical protein